MRTIVRTMPLTLGMVMLGTVLAPRASAQCAFFEGPKASAFEPRGSGQSQPALRPVSSLPVSDSGDSDERGIVGFWKVTFVAEGNPVGAELERRVREAAHAILTTAEYQLA